MEGARVLVVLLTLVQVLEQIQEQVQEQALLASVASARVSELVVAVLLS